MGIKFKLKKFIFEHKVLAVPLSFFKSLFVRKKRKYVFQNEGLARLKKDIEGGGHSIIIKKGCVLRDCSLRIRGKNNVIIFEEGCSVGPDCAFLMEGNNIRITVGKGTTFTRKCEVNAQEHGSEIVIGEDCMFSNRVIVRTSDSHPVYDRESGERINPAKNIVIGKHVWIAPNTKIMKGAIIGNGVIIGSDTTVSKEIPDNVMVVGRPARIVKENVEWTREALF